MAGKVETYLGFCLRARKIVLGSGSVDAVKKGVYLIIVCSTASENTFKVALKYKNRFSCPLLICKVGLADVLHTDVCKIAAVKDAELAKAIIANAGDEYELYTER
ncbi:MAG: hypothetical protein K2N14_04005 [Clostridia bacterium]|nr:hypothetical protein [Clostridia bacterium]